MNKSVLLQHYAANGAVFLIDNLGRVNITETKISSNEAASKGGVFSIIKSDFGALLNSWVSIHNCIYVISNNAEEGGLIHVENEYMNINISSSKLQ